jgi:hypothetical protein
VIPSLKLVLSIYKQIDIPGLITIQDQSLISQFISKYTEVIQKILSNQNCQANDKLLLLLNLCSQILMKLGERVQIQELIDCVKGQN